MTDNKVGQVLRAYCSKCRGDRNCEIVGYHTERGEDGDGYYQWYRQWYLLTCRGCDHVFAQTVSTNSEDYYQEYGPNGETITIYHETIESWPAKSKRERPEWFEGGSVETDVKETSALDASLSELYGALDADLKVLASIGIRTSFDIAAEVLGVKPNMPFQHKVGALVARGYIKESEKEHIDILIDAGSASAHRGWRPRIGDLDALMETLEDFIYNNLVLPARKKAAAAKIANVKAKVPPKEKAEPKQKKAKAET